LKIKPRKQFYQPEAPVEEEYVPASQSAHADAPVPAPVQAANNLNGTSARPLAICGVQILSVQLEKSCWKKYAGEACENANIKQLGQLVCREYDTAT
jgi:hypothetical protein